MYLCTTTQRVEPFYSLTKLWCSSAESQKSYYNLLQHLFLCFCSPSIGSQTSLTIYVVTLQ